MKVNLNRAIKSIKGKIDFYQPLYEAIVNSFQAGATEIKINFEKELRDGQEYVVGYTVLDNGEGYDDSNIDHFLTLWTDHKVKIGALGSGRILCLKVFNNMIIKSQTKNQGSTSGQKVEIDFNRNFKANSVDEIHRMSTSSDKSYTETVFKNINEEYKKEYEKQKKPFLEEEIQEKIFINLLPLFSNKKYNEDEFSIEFAGEEWLNKDTLSEKFEELSFEEKTFTLRTKYEDKTDEDYIFTLTYRISNDGLGKLAQFYGAADRRVRDFTKSVKLNPLPEKNSGIFCLTSPYFNTRIQDSRTDFTVSVTEQLLSDEHPITFPSINLELEKLLKDILFDRFPNIKKELDDNKQEASKKYPHLSKYMNDVNKLGLSVTDIINEAEDVYRKQSKATRDKVLQFSEEIKSKDTFDYEKYKSIVNEFTENGKEQLAQYIGYRQTIIEMLFNVLKCNRDKELDSFNEDYIHNLIMPPHMIKKDCNHRITENNFWIIDDKFMSYSYAASDEQINKILESLSIEMEYDQNDIDILGADRPDILMLYSDEYSNKKDVVIIELKKLNIGAYDRSKAVDQINLYADIVRENIPDVNDVFVYAIVDLDHRLEKILKMRSFLPKSFSRDGHNMYSYYMYNPNNEAHVSILSFEHLIQDADKRNRLFLEILRSEIIVDSVISQDTIVEEIEEEIAV